MLLDLEDPSEFLGNAVDPPEARAILNSVDFLENLQAVELVDGVPQLTALGYHLAQLPVSPRVGKVTPSNTPHIYIITFCLSYRFYYLGRYFSVSMRLSRLPLVYRLGLPSCRLLRSGLKRTRRGGACALDFLIT